MLSTRGLMMLANPESKLLIIQASGRGDISGALAPCMLSMADMDAVAKLLAVGSIGSEAVISKYVVKSMIIVQNDDGTTDSECVNLADLISWAKQHVATTRNIN